MDKEITFQVDDPDLTIDLVLRDAVTGEVDPALSATFDMNTGPGSQCDHRVWVKSDRPEWQPETLYRVEFYDGDFELGEPPFYSFLYYGCQGGGMGESSFYCPYGTVGNPDLIVVIRYRDHDPKQGPEVLVAPLAYSAELAVADTGIGDYFSDGNWMIPYNLEVVADATGETAYDIGFFITPQDGPPFTATAEADFTLHSNAVVGDNDWDGTYDWVETTLGWAPADRVLRFPPRRRLVVKGDLVAEGVTLTEAVSGQGWNGLFFEQGSTGTLTGATVRDAAFTCPDGPGTCALPGYFGAVSAYNATVALDRTAVTNTGGDGLIVAGAHADVTVTATPTGLPELPSRFLQNSGYGVRALSGATVRLEEGTLVQANAAGGVRASGSGTILSLAEGVEVFGNGGPGVEARQNAAATLVPSTTYGQQVFVEQNEGRLAAQGGGLIQTGLCQEGQVENPIVCTHTPHEITLNSSDGTYFDARALTGSNVSARGNFWRLVTDPCDEGALDLVRDGSSGIAVVPLATVPGTPASGCPGARLAGGATRGGGAAFGDGALLPVSGTSGRGSGAEALALVAQAEDALAAGDTLTAGGLIAEALALVAADAEADEDDRRAAFEGATRLLALVQPAGVVAWLEAQATEPDSLRPWARRALVIAHARLGQVATAEAGAEVLVQEDAAGEHGRYGHCALVRLAVEASAEATSLARLSAMAASFLDHEETAEAAALVAAAFPGADVSAVLNGGRLGGPGDGMLTQARVTGGSASGFSLSSVRPNPAAGTAVLPLSLAAEAEVAAVLYDALGRRVAVIHSGVLTAGRHALALEVAGLPVGVYVVHVTMRRGSLVERAVERVTVAR